MSDIYRVLSGDRYRRQPTVQMTGGRRLALSPIGMLLLDASEVDQRLLRELEQIRETIENNTGDDAFIASLSAGASRELRALAARRGVRLADLLRQMYQRAGMSRQASASGLNAGQRTAFYAQHISGASTRLLVALLGYDEK